MSSNLFKSYAKIYIFSTKENCLRKSHSHTVWESVCDIRIQRKYHNLLEKRKQPFNEDFISFFPTKFHSHAENDPNDANLRRKNELI